MLYHHVILIIINGAIIIRPVKVHSCHNDLPNEAWQLHWFLQFVQVEGSYVKYFSNTQAEKVVSIMHRIAFPQVLTIPQNKWLVPGK